MNGLLRLLAILLLVTAPFSAVRAQQQEDSSVCPGELYVYDVTAYPVHLGGIPWCQENVLLLSPTGQTIYVEWQRNEGGIGGLTVTLEGSGFHGQAYPLTEAQRGGSGSQGPRIIYVSPWIHLPEWISESIRATLWRDGVPIDSVEFTTTAGARLPSVPATCESRGFGIYQEVQAAVVGLSASLSHACPPGHLDARVLLPNPWEFSLKWYRNVAGLRNVTAVLQGAGFEGVRVPLHEATGTSAKGLQPLTSYNSGLLTVPEGASGSLTASLYHEGVLVEIVTATVPALPG